MRMGLNSRQLGGSRLDPDAKLYIATVQAALGATTIEAALPNATNPRKIISDFYIAEKDAARYSLHKAIFLPIYNNLAANAVDAITAASGTFAGTVTVASGYVQGDGLTGYFDVLQSPADLSMALTSQAMSYLTLSADLVGTRSVISGYESASANFDLFSSDTQTRFNINAGPALNANLTRLDQIGIFIGSRTPGNSSIYQRRSSFASLASTTPADTGTVSTQDINIMRSRFGGGSFYSNRQLGSYGIHDGLSAANAEGYSLNLKNLWESLTGLTLP
jgi:hypothetical protein